MNIKSQFYVKTHPHLKSEDLPSLPKELQDKFEKVYKKILAVDPYNCVIKVSEEEVFRLNYHELSSERELSGYRAIEIDYTVEGYKEVYRLVYKIKDKDEKNKAVEIVSFGLHDYAYDIARKRVTFT